MEETVELLLRMEKATDAIEDAKQIVFEEKDEEMRSFLKAEMEENEAKLPEFEEKNEGSFTYLVTRWMIKILCLKSAAVQAVMKQTFLLVI